MQSEKELKNIIDKILWSATVYSTDRDAGRNNEFMSPFVYDRHVYATNKSICVRTDRKYTDIIYNNWPQFENYIDMFANVDINNMTGTIKFSDIYDAVVQYDKIKESILSEYTKRDNVCPECNGSGRVIWKYRSYRKVDDCPECDGTGRGMTVDTAKNKLEFIQRHRLLAYFTINDIPFDYNVIIRLYNMMNVSGSSELRYNIRPGKISSKIDFSFMDGLIIGTMMSCYIDEELVEKENIAKINIVS